MSLSHSQGTSWAIFHMHRYMRYAYKQTHTGQSGKCKADFELRVCEEKYGNSRTCVIWSSLYVEMCWGMFWGFFLQCLFFLHFLKSFCVFGYDVCMWGVGACVCIGDVYMESRGQLWSNSLHSPLPGTRGWISGFTFTQQTSFTHWAILPGLTQDLWYLLVAFRVSLCLSLWLRMSLSNEDYAFITFGLCLLCLTVLGCSEKH